MYLPDEFATTIDMLTDESCGRLFRALFSGKAPDGGIELAIYTTAKAFLGDQQPSISEIMSANGKKGGRPKKTEKAAFETEKAAFSEKKAAFETEKAAFQEEESSPCPPSSPSLPPTPPIIPPIIPQTPKEEEGNLTTAIAGAGAWITQEEAEKTQAVLDTIEDAAMNAGLNTNAYALDTAIKLKDQYGIDPLLNAIQKSSISTAKPSWSYVEGILKNNGQKKGSKPTKVVSAQQYTQRDYGENELMEVGGTFASLLDETRRLAD